MAGQPGMILDAIREAVRLIFGGSSALGEIVALSLQVTLIATLISAVGGYSGGRVAGDATLPRTAADHHDYLYRDGACRLSLLGWRLYLLMSRQGPLGGLEWLFTPRAMVVAQTIIATPGCYWDYVECHRCARSRIRDATPQSRRDALAGRPRDDL